MQTLVFYLQILRNKYEARKQEENINIFKINFNYLI